MSNVSIKILKLLAVSVLVVGCKGLYSDKSPNKAIHIEEHEHTDAHAYPDTKTLQNEAAVVHNATSQARTVQQSVPYTVKK